MTGGPEFDVGDLVRRLGLAPHPEGGFYRETFRSPRVLHLPDDRTRPASTAILYLLPSGSHSAWHRVASDEVWHHYAGGALRLYRLGAGERLLDRDDPQAVVLAPWRRDSTSRTSSWATPRRWFEPIPRTRP